MPFSKYGGIGGLESWKNFSLRVLLMPAFFFILWIFYYQGFQVGIELNEIQALRCMQERLLATLF